MRADRVVLVTPRGYCAGVEMAVKALAFTLLRYGPPVYCVHPIVHNRRVVERFENLGVRFVESGVDIPAGAVAVLSAHGTSPTAAKTVRSRASVVVDAVCPLVTKVHHEIAQRAAAGDRILYVGHAGHDETAGALGVAPEATTLIESVEDLPDLADTHQAVALLAQTTLAVEQWVGILSAVRAVTDGRVWTARRSDVCYATSNRQSALRSAVSECDAVIVVGSATSSNTAALVAVAEEAGAPLVLRVDGAAELPLDGRCGTVAVTAGASAPETAVAEVVEALGAPSVVTRGAKVETQYFPLPGELRETVTDDPVTSSLALRDRYLSSEALVRAAEVVLGVAPLPGAVHD